MKFINTLVFLFLLSNLAFSQNIDQDKPLTASISASKIIISKGDTFNKLQVNYESDMKFCSIKGFRNHGVDNFYFNNVDSVKILDSKVELYGYPTVDGKFNVVSEESETDLNRSKIKRAL